jgi:energy-converting hydrogenase A subunit M
MGFVEDVNFIKTKMDVLIETSKILTPELIEGIAKTSDIDVDELVTAATVLSAFGKEITEVHNGIEDIKRVVEMQNQVHHVSDARKNIGLVAGKLKDIRAVKELSTSIIQCNGLEPTLKEVLSMNEDIRLVLENKEKIEDINVTMSGMQDALNQMESMYLRTRKDLEEISKIKSDIEDLSADMRMHSNIASAEMKKLKEFQVKSFTIQSDRKGYSKYEPKENTLNLFIPKGEKGEKGEKGSDGRRGQRGIPGTATNQGKQGEAGRDGNNGENFKIDIFGMKREMAMYGNRAVGTSFLSLDESPVMIYFRKSNTLDDWTDGQPFGMSHGDFSVSEIAGAVVQLLNEQGATNGNKQSK